MDDLAVVVDPADRAEADRHQQGHPDEAVREVAPQQRRHGDRDQDQRAAHRRRAGLDEVRLRPVVAHRLADLHPRQPGDHLRPDEERDQERGHARQHRAQREVAEDVERADVLRQELGQPEQHQCAPAAVSPASAATTRSIRMKREPLTSTVVPARARSRDAAPRSASTVAKCSAPAPNAAALSAASAPTVSRAIDARRPRVLADFAVERGPLVADFAHVAQHQPARRGHRGQHVDRGAHRIGIRVVRVVDHRDAGRRPQRREPPGDRPKRFEAARRPRTAARRSPAPRSPPRARSTALCRPGASSRSVASPAGVATRERAVGRARARAAVSPPDARARNRRRARRPRARGGAPHVDGRVVGVEHGRTAVRQRTNERRVLRRDVGDALHEFLVLALRVVDERDRRLRDRRELGGLARVVHAELDRRRRVLARAGAAASAAGRSRC